MLTPVLIVCYLRQRVQRGDPLYPVRILGSKCKVHESDQQYHATEREVNLVKWNGRDDTTIDRFDGEGPYQATPVPRPCTSAPLQLTVFPPPCSPQFV